jgi:hypothetical protein
MEVCVLFDFTYFRLSWQEKSIVVQMTFNVNINILCSFPDLETINYILGFITGLSEANSIGRAAFG